MFKMIDTDNSGQITFEELKAGLARVGAHLDEPEVKALMEAVIYVLLCLSNEYHYFCHFLIGEFINLHAL
jgi:EF hand